MARKKVKVREVTSLHPKTVATAGEHMKRRRHPRTAKEPPVETIKVNPILWKEALKRADGNPRRLVVHSATEVTVRNNPIRGVPRVEREPECHEKTDTPTTKSTPDDSNDATDPAMTQTTPNESTSRPSTTPTTRRGETDPV